MKIKLVIDTTEQYSNRKNLLDLIGMVVDESCGDDAQGQTSYFGNGGRQTCAYSLTLTREEAGEK